MHLTIATQETFRQLLTDGFCFQWPMKLRQLSDGFKCLQGESIVILMRLIGEFENLTSPPLTVPMSLWPVQIEASKKLASGKGKCMVHSAATGYEYDNQGAMLVYATILTIKFGVSVNLQKDDIRFCPKE